MDFDGLQAENRQLKEAVALRDNEITALKELAQLQQDAASVEGQAAKVIELSKKNRALNLALEKEKHKVAKLQQTLSELAQAADGTVGPKAHAGAHIAVDPTAGSADSVTREVASLRDRLALQTKRISALEQKVYLLEGENKKMTRALAREVGEDVPLSKVLDEGSDWKGRRELVIALKDTIRRLREEQGQAPVSRHDTAHKAAIAKLNKGRLADAERTAAELADARGELDKVKMLYAGSASRRKVLEAETADLKAKLRTVLAKTANDDKLIAALRAELGLATANPGGCGAAAQGGGTYAELVELRQRCVEQEEQIHQQQKIILHLQEQQRRQQQEQQQQQQQQSQQQQNQQNQQYQDHRAKVGPEDARLEELMDENAEMRQRVATLQDDLAYVQRPGTSGTSSALRQQVLALQAECEQLRAQLGHRQLRQSNGSATHLDALPPQPVTELPSQQVTQLPGDDHTLREQVACDGGEGVNSRAGQMLSDSNSQLSESTS